MRNNEYMQTKGCNVLSSFIRQIAWRIPSALCCLALVASLFSCDSDKPDNLEPQLTTLSATGITRTDATLNGQATVEGETEMPQLYFRYGLTEEMEQTASADGDGSPSVASHITGLTPTTTYYYPKIRNK